MHVKQQRKCIACRQSKQQNEMLRIARINGNYQIDVNQKLGGRGSYVCFDNNCINLVLKKKILNKVFKTNVPNDIYEILGEYEKNN